MGKNIGCGLALHKGLSLVHAVSSYAILRLRLSVSEFQFSSESVTHDMSESVRKFADKYQSRNREIAHAIAPAGRNVYNRRCQPADCGSSPPRKRGSRETGFTSFV